MVNDYNNEGELKKIDTQMVCQRHLIKPGTLIAEGRGDSHIWAIKVFATV